MENFEKTIKEITNEPISLVKLLYDLMNRERENNEKEITVDLIREMINTAIKENYYKEQELQHLATKLIENQNTNGVSLTILYIRENISCDYRFIDILIARGYKFGKELLESSEDIEEMENFEKTIKEITNEPIKPFSLLYNSLLKKKLELRLQAIDKVMKVVIENINEHFQYYDEKDYKRIIADEDLTVYCDIIGH